VSEIGDVRSDVQSVLAQMKVLQAQAGLKPPSTDEAAAVDRPNESFASMLKTATDSVNELQKASGAAQSAFVTGQSDDLVGVMIAGQKSSVAFQGLMHTRNHLVRAYQDIMNMTI